MSKKDNKSSKKKSDSDGKKIEWDLSDGFDWRDFLGIFVLIGQFFWKLARLIFAPAFWIYGENWRMYRFARASGHERILTEDERWFVETIPMVYTLTGLIGGILMGIIVAANFREQIRAFFENFSFEAIVNFLEFLGSILGAIARGLVWLFDSVMAVFSWLLNTIVQAFAVDPILALVGLLILGIVVMSLYIGVSETGFFRGFYDFLYKALVYVVGSPERFRAQVNSFYRRANHKLTVFLVGKRRLHTRTQVYFKKIVGYTFLLSIYSFISGFVIAVNPDYLDELQSTFNQVVFVATVLLVAGVVAGTIFFAFVARLLDLFSRKKYIAPQFIKDDVIDAEAIAKHTEEDEKRIAEALRVPEEITTETGKKPAKKEAEN